jgi:F0F1-type ATP synthase assembly protein I
MDDKKMPNAPWWQAGLQLFLRLSAWIVAPILLAVVVGKFLDKIFHTQPWLFLVTIIASFTFSMTMIVRIGLKEIDKKE